jgi:ELWxxDGT repeat protein
MSARTSSDASFFMSTLEPRVMLSAQFPADLLAVGNRAFFTAEDSVNGRELWVSDGTAAGTKVVRNIGPGSADANIYGLTTFGNRVAFAASDGTHGRELWVSDGTTAGTFMVKDILPGSQEGFPTALKAIGNTLYFSAGTSSLGRELWKSDGTAAGTVFVKDIYQGNIGSGSLGFTEVNGTVFFSADSAITTGQGNHTNTTYFGRELWKTDGTAAGTVMVRDIRDGFGDSMPSQLTNLNGTLLFTAYTGDLGWELWRSNGTSTGTVLVEDINPSFRSSDPRALRTDAGQLYFNAIDGNFNQDLWRSNGTAAGTNVAADFAPGFTGFMIPATFINVGAESFFFAVGQNLGLELWRTDHTAAGTRLVREIVPPNDFQTNPYIAPTMGRAGNRLFFTAFDHVIGLELYLVTPTGATLLKDIFPGNGFAPSPQNFTEAGGRLFFTADDGAHGSEMWVSDGTPAGTRRVADAPLQNRQIAHKPIGAPNQTDRTTFGQARIADFLTADEEPLALD